MTSALPPSSPEAKFARSLVRDGHYKDEQSVLAAGIRLLQRQERERQEILDLIEQGRRSGVAEHRSVEQRLKDNRARRAARG